MGSSRPCFLQRKRWGSVPNVGPYRGPRHFIIQLRTFLLNGMLPYLICSHFVVSLSTVHGLTSGLSMQVKLVFAVVLQQIILSASESVREYTLRIHIWFCVSVPGCPSIGQYNFGCRPGTLSQEHTLYYGNTSHPNIKIFCLAIGS